MHAIDLFAGAGGLSEGFEAVGIRVLLAQELHPQPALTLALNHRGTPVVVGDIRNADLKVISKLIQKYHKFEQVDIVMGGPPCQGFSTAGKKNAADPRNSLAVQFCRMVAAVRPNVVVFENVPGFKKMYGGQAYSATRTALQDLGYDIQDEILNAADYGVPQRRQRFFMVGVKSTLGLKYRWPEKSHSRQTRDHGQLFGLGYSPYVTVQEALADLEFVTPGFEGNRHIAPPLSLYQKSRRANSTLLFNHLATRHRPKAVEMFSHIAEGATISSVPQALRSAKRTMARMSRVDISNAVLALPDDMIHYDQHRIPSVREMARLQSFDDSFVFMGKRTSGFVERKVDVPQYTQVGNSVPPLLAAEIGKSIMAMFGLAPLDKRDLAARQEMHEWVQGSSAHAGYTLSEDALAHIYDLAGRPIQLPIDHQACPVRERPAVVEWAGRIGMPRQWSPGVMKGEPRTPVC